MTPTPTATQLQEGDQGDEGGVRVTVLVRVQRGRILARPRTVAAFLPLRYKVTNQTQRRVVVRITGSEPVQIAPGLTVAQDSRGEKPGRIRVAAGDRRAILRVKPGG